MVMDPPGPMLFLSSSKSTKFYTKQFPKAGPIDGLRGVTPQSRTPSPNGGMGSPSPPSPTWRIKTQLEYIQSLSASEIRKKGGQTKLEKQPANRYFKRQKLADIVLLHGQTREDLEQLQLFVHFLHGVLDPDPWKRWTAMQASQHPFVTGGKLPQRRTKGEKQEGGIQPTTDSTAKAGGNKSRLDVHWMPPWDPSICRRKLLNVQKTRDKQQAMGRSFATAGNNSATGRSMMTDDSHGIGHHARREIIPPIVGGSG